MHQVQHVGFGWLGAAVFLRRTQGCARQRHRQNCKSGTSAHCNFILPRVYAGELRTARVLLGSLLVFLLIEHFTFNRFYPRAASPDSTTGHVELMMGNERKRPKPDRNQVLIIGNSRMSFFPRYTDPLRGELGYTFATIASAGTQPRCWY